MQACGAGNIKEQRACQISTLASSARHIVAATPTVPTPSPLLTAVVVAAAAAEVVVAGVASVVVSASAAVCV